MENTIIITIENGMSYSETNNAPYHKNHLCTIPYVTPLTRHPKCMSSEGVTLRDYDCDSLTFSFTELTPVPVSQSYAQISIINKFFLHIHYIYHHSGIHYILYTYTRVSLLILLQFHYYKTIHIKSDIAEQCGEHLSLRWFALLMWNFLSSILVFCFCTYTD